MAFALSDPRAVRSDIRRLLREQYGRAEAAIDDRNVHRVRTSCKRAGGVLRLAGQLNESELLRQLNRRTRDVAGAVGGARDDQVVAHTIERLARHLPEIDAADVIASLGIAQEGKSSEEVDWESLGAELGRLAEAASKIEAPDRAPWGAIADAYRRARDLMPASADVPAEELHRWRKHAKRHWYQMRVLGPLWPRVMRARAADLNVLTEDLGEHHDLEVAIGRLRQSQAPWFEELCAGAEHRQRRVARRAIRTGSRAFAGSPEALISWLKPLWKAWKQDA